MCMHIHVYIHANIYHVHIQCSHEKRKGARKREERGKEKAMEDECDQDILYILMAMS